MTRLIKKEIAHELDILVQKNNSEKKDIVNNFMIWVRTHKIFGRLMVLGIVIGCIVALADDIKNLASFITHEGAREVTMNVIVYIITHDFVMTLFVVFSLLAYIYMFFHLRKKGNMQNAIGFFGFWPGILFEYKNFTKAEKGSIGIMFYIFIFSVSIAIILFLIQFIGSFIVGPIVIDQSGMYKC